MNIEQLAVSEIERVISRVPILEANINSRDKVPSWDGEIEVYGREGDYHSKKDLIWTIPVQVKGKKEKDPKQFEKKHIKYSVEISDMNNYLIKGGTMFFVVCIDETGNNTKIYYKKFLPYDLKKELKRSKNQKSRTIVFEAFPTDINEITNVFLAFASDMKKQRATIDIDDEDIIVALKKGDPAVEITFGLPVTSLEKSPLEYVFEHGIYLYANFSGEKLRYPIIYVDHVERVGQTKKSRVTVRGKLFFDQIQVAVSENKTEILIGKNIRMIGYKENNWEGDKFYFTLAGTLSERINTVEFLLAILQAGQFEIDGDVYSLNKEKIDLPECFSASSLEKYLQSMLVIKQTLVILGVEQELNCDGMSEKDLAAMHALKKAVIDSELIPLSLERSGYGFYSVADLHILVFGGEEQNGKFKIYNFFDDRITIEVNFADGNRYKMAPCVFLSKDDLLKCSNLNAKNIISSVVNIPISDAYSDYLTQFLLELLKAYDESCSQREDILDIALELSDWIRKEDTICSNVISQINYYQAVKRKRELNDEEIADLVELTESSLKKEEQYVGAYLLLDNQKSAAVHFNRMTSVEQESFRQYPIYRFGKSAF